MKIEGQVALVTGGASGLGAETARELARRGAKVAVLDRNGEGAKAVAAEIAAQRGAGSALGIACDITSSRQRRRRACRRHRRARRAADRHEHRRHRHCETDHRQGRHADAARRLHARRRRQSGRHLQRHPPRRGADREARSAARWRRHQRARRDGLHCLGRRLRRPGRPGGLCGIERGDRLAHLAFGAGPGAARHPRRHHRTGPVPDAIARRAARGGAGITGGEHSLSEKARQAGRVRAIWPPPSSRTRRSTAR